MNLKEINLNEITKNEGEKMKSNNLNIGDINIGNVNDIPKVAVNQKTAINDLMNQPYVCVVEYVIPKKELEEYVRKNVIENSDVNYMNITPLDFQRILVHDTKNSKGVFDYSNGVTNEELNNFKRLYFPSADGNVANKSVATNPLQGLIVVKVKKNENLATKPSNILEYSKLDDPEEFYSNPLVKKFSIGNYRKIWSTNVDTGVMTHYIPVVLVALAKLGFNPEEIIKEYYISLGESSNDILVHIRKEI